LLLLLLLQALLHLFIKRSFFRKCHSASASFSPIDLVESNVFDTSR